MGRLLNHLANYAKITNSHRLSRFYHQQGEYETSLLSRFYLLGGMREMQAVIESLESLGISLDHEIRCQFTRGALRLPCEEIAVVRITFRCTCGYSGEAFIGAYCLDRISNSPKACTCTGCGKCLKPHRWSKNRIKWKAI